MSSVHGSFSAMYRSAAMLKRWLLDRDEVLEYREP
jgi:hypothetical protein